MRHPDLPACSPDRALRSLAPAFLALALAACATARSTPPPASPPAPAATPSALAPAVPLASLREAHQTSCAAVASTGNSLCELQSVTPLPDGRVLVAGAFRGEVRIGTSVIRSRGMQNSLLAMLAPDGSVAWLRQHGVQWHNSILRLVPLSDGRFAAAGVAANGFHPALSVRPTKRDLEFNSERPFVGVLTAQGEWAWIRDWPASVDDLRAEPEGGFAVLDLAQWTRLGGDGAVAAQRPLAALPTGALAVEYGSRLGASGCTWQLFTRWAGEVTALVARSTCGGTTSDWPLANVLSPQTRLHHATSPDGTVFFVDAADVLERDAKGPSRGSIRQTLWRLEAERGIRWTVRTWPTEQAAVLAEERSEPLALLAGDDTLDLLVGYKVPCVVAGAALPAATVPSPNGLPRAAVIVRHSARDGAPLGVFAPDPTAGAALVRKLAVALLAQRPVLARSADSAVDRWIYGYAAPCAGCPEGDHAGVATIEAVPATPTPAR